MKDSVCTMGKEIEKSLVSNVSLGLQENGEDLVDEMRFRDDNRT